MTLTTTSYAFLIEYDPFNDLNFRTEYKLVKYL